MKTTEQARKELKLIIDEMMAELKSCQESQEYGIVAAAKGKASEVMSAANIPAGTARITECHPDVIERLEADGLFGVTYRQYAGIGEHLRVYGLCAEAVVGGCSIEAALRDARRFSGAAVLNEYGDLPEDVS